MPRVSQPQSPIPVAGTVTFESRPDDPLAANPDPFKKFSKPNGPAVSQDSLKPDWALNGPAIAPDKGEAANAKLLPNGPAIRMSSTNWSEPMAGPAVAPGCSYNPSDNPACPADASPETADRPRLWLTTDFLLFWEKRQPLPAGLLSTGSPTDPFPGALGQPHTTGVSPDEIGHGVFAGVRLTGGAWLDADSVFGLEASGFVLQDRGGSFGIASNSSGSPLLALTHTNEPVGTPATFIIAGSAVPGGNSGAFAGGVVLRTDSQLWGSEGTALFSLWRSKDYQVSALVGVRYLHLDQDLTIFASKSALNYSEITFLGQSFGPPFTGPASELTQDSFQTRNQFWGGQAGLRGEYRFDRFFLLGETTLALGGTEELSSALGASTLQLQKAPPLVAPGGLYALPSNGGSVRKGEFGVVPEVQLKAGVELTSWCRATIGYDFLYWSRVMRPGNQIDTAVDARQVPTDPSFAPGVAAGFPHAQSIQSSFWIQGVTLGLEFSY
jgi:hypothetical protein